MATQTIKHSLMPKRILNKYKTLLTNKRISKTTQVSRHRPQDEKISLSWAKQVQLTKSSRTFTNQSRMNLIR
ncbi:MAG: hypothetical protein ACXAB7_15715 [Candidatus Kariarchaeaceae archaeon]